MKKRGNELSKLYIFLLVGIIFGLFFLFRDSGITGYAVYDNNIFFDLDESWNLTDSVLAITLNDHYEEKNLSEFVEGNKIIVNLTKFNLNLEKGTLFVDIVINNNVVASRSFEIVGEDVNESINETIELNKSEVEENKSIEDVNKTIEENKTRELNTSLEENITNEEIQEIPPPINITRVSLTERYGSNIQERLKQHLVSKGFPESIRIDDVQTKFFSVGSKHVIIEIEKDGKKISWITSDEKIRELMK